MFLFFYINHKDDFISCEFFPFSISKKVIIFLLKKVTFLCQSLKKELNLFKEFNIENVVTLETSYFGCVKELCLSIF